ncbi:MAG: VanW family protein [Clostridia bacterium]|nr:VanW family protein [Clostridia bacterium]
MPSLTRAGYVPPRKDKKTDKKPMPQPPKKPKKKGKPKKRGKNAGAAAASLAVLAACALIGGATLYMYLRTEPYLDAFCPGTTLSGYPLGGSSYASGEALLAQLTDEAIANWSYTLTWQGETFALTAEDIALHVDASATLEPLWQAGREGGLIQRYWSQAQLLRQGVAAEPVLAYDMEPADEFLARIKEEIECDPVDARVTFASGSSEPFRFTGESAGRRLDTAPLRTAIERSILSLTSGETQLEPESIEPGVYEAELRNAITLRARVVMSIAADEASFTNASLAAQEMNGQRAEPGEALSLNKLVGARTVDAGFVTAKEPAYGADVSGVGGGVCQIATALYQAALLADIEIDERHAAVRPVSYSEPGQEAAVSDQGLDLVLVNSTRFPLFVTARVYRDGEAAYAEVQLIGEPLEERYALESVTEETQSIDEPVYVRDSEGRYATYTDERVPVTDGEPGYSASVYCVELSVDGEELSRHIVSTDHYDPVAPAIYVGVTERE